RIMYLDHFLKQAKGDHIKASEDYALWFAGKLRMKDNVVVEIAQKIIERKSHYKGRQLSEENARYFELVRSFIETEPRKMTFSAFKVFWKSLPLSVKKNK